MIEIYFVTSRVVVMEKSKPTTKKNKKKFETKWMLFLPINLMRERMPSSEYNKQF
jgi:hypothetical protein